MLKLAKDLYNWQMVLLINVIRYSQDAIDALAMDLSASNAMEGIWATWMEINKSVELVAHGERHALDVI